MGAQSTLLLLSADAARGSPLSLTETDRVPGRGAHGVDSFLWEGQRLLSIPNYYGCGSSRGPAAADCASTAVYTLNAKTSALQQIATLPTAGPSQTAHYTSRDGAVFVLVAENFDDKVCFYAAAKGGGAGPRFERRRCFSVPGAGAMAIAEFGDTLIFVAASYHDNGWRTQSRVYVADARAAAALDFREVQQLATRGAHDAELAVLDGTLFLFVAEDRDETTPRIDSSLYKWDAGAQMFVLVQRVPTDGAHGAKLFEGPDGSAFLMIANFGDRHGQRYSARSELWRKARGAPTFSRFDAVDSQGATDAEHFVLRGRHFIALANEGDVGKRAHQTSYVYELIVDDRAHGSEEDL